MFWPRSGFTPTPGRPILPVDHGEVGDRHDRGRALAVLGDAEAVIDRAVAAGGKQPRGAADQLGGHAGQLLDLFRAVARLGDERGPVLELRPVAALADEFLVEQPLGDDDMRERGRPRRHWCRASAADDTAPRHAPSARCRCGADRATISLAPLRSRFFSREANTGWPSVGLAPMIMTTSVCSTRIEILGAGRGAEGRSSGRSRSANGRRGRRCRHCCCRNPGAPASGRDRSPRWCSATR